METTSKFSWRSGYVFYFFTLRRSLRQFLIISALMVVLIVSSAVAYVALYPTPQARSATALALGGNAGLNALIGKPEALDTVEGFVAWRSVGVATLVLAIWALFITTKLLRGDEDQERWELLLVGKATLVRATRQVVSALATLSLIIFSLTFGATLVASQAKGLGWSMGKIGFMSLSLVAIFMIFASVGALVSQLVATRPAALRLGGLVFGVFFMLRALGDISNQASWLAKLSPLGWVELLRPLTSQNYFWFAPIAAFIFWLLLAAFLIASHRDYRGSLIKDRDTKKPNIWLLGSAPQFFARLHFASLVPWLLGLFIANVALGSFIGVASGAIGQSGGVQQQIGQITNSASTNSATLILGVIFLEMVLALMFIVAGQVGKFRYEESKGYLDNLLVRPVARFSLISCRAVYIFIGLLLACAAIYAGSLLGTTTQHISIGGWLYVSSAVNLAAAPWLLAGMGICIMGFWPNRTTPVLYFIIAWSFVMEIVGSLLQLNHWVLDTSLLHHLAIAPAAAVKWPVFWVYIAAGLLLTVVGIWGFLGRDIETE